MTRFKSIALLVSTILITATPARADWQFTKWGMTQSELQRVAPIKLDNGYRCPVNNSNNSSMRYKVEFTSEWKVGDMSFIACYLFLNNKLHIVNLFSKNAEIEAVVKGLSQKYGSPTIDTTLREIGIIRYVWDRRDETVGFSIRSFKGVDYPYTVSYESKAGSNEISVREGL